MRKMLCLLLLLAMLTPCLPALAEDTDALDVILLSSASIEPLQETLRPGKAVTLRFTSPVDGTVTALYSSKHAIGITGPDGDPQTEPTADEAPAEAAPTD